MLHDIDAERLATSELVARRICQALGAPAKVSATTDRRAALDGADYAINMIQVGGYEPCTVTDFEVPKAFGLRQTIGDTLGIGGIMRGLRTIPVLLAMCADMEELLSRCLVPQLHKPDGNELPSDQPGRAGSAPSASVTACKAPPSSSHVIWVFPIARSTI